MDSQRYRIKCKEDVHGLTAGQFAGFLFSFDALYDDIMASKNALLPLIEQQILDWKKEKMVEELVSTTVRAHIDQYLRPQGLSAWFSIKDGIVSLHIRKKDYSLEGDLDVPFEKIAETLQDTDKILSLLKPVDTGHSPFRTPVRRGNITFFKP